MMRQVSEQALSIAVDLMDRAGMCLYEDRSQCDKFRKGRPDCSFCIRKFLISKAKDELNTTICE